MSKQEDLETIHESLVNGNRRQMVEQIDEYGVYDFWADYRDFLWNTCQSPKAEFAYFADATVSYFRIKSR